MTIGTMTRVLRRSQDIDGFEIPDFSKARKERAKEQRVKQGFLLRKRLHWKIVVSWLLFFFSFSVRTHVGARHNFANGYSTHEPMLIYISGVLWMFNLAQKVQGSMWGGPFSQTDSPEHLVEWRGVRGMTTRPDLTLQMYPGSRVVSGAVTGY